MNNEQLSLAPAAGSGIVKLLADALLARPNFIGELVEVIESGFHAAKRFWDPETKTWIQEPDVRTRIATLTLVLAHMEGEPIRKIIHQHIGAGGGIDPLVSLRESPATRDAMRRMLEQAEWHDSGQQDYKRPVKSANGDTRQAAVEVVVEIEKPAGGF